MACAAAAMVLLAPAPADGGAPGVKVPLWGRFETRLRNAKSYANPFRDVELQADFTGPTGRTVRVLGFHDGDGEGGQRGDVWKLRFMPDEVGTWSFTCAFSDGTPGTSGRFDCVAEGAKPGPVRVDGRWFRTARGERFNVRSCYFSEAFTAKSPRWEAAIDETFGGARGFNFCCTTFWQGRLLLERKWNTLPYNGFYPIVAGDFTRPDVAAWRHVDEVLGRLESRGAYWFNFDGFVPNVGGTMGAQRTDSEAQKVYIRNAVARLAPYWNVTWNVAFEWAEFLSPAQVRQVARYTKALDPWTHPLTVHDQGGLEPRRLAPELGIDFVTLQFDAGKCGDAVAANRFVRKYDDGRPIYAQEVCWEGPDKLDADRVRKGTWGVALGGGIPNYAEQFDGVQGNGKAFPYVKVLLDFIESVPYDRMRPRDELVSPGALCTAEPGSCYVCYAPSGGQFELDLSATRGRFRAEWFDPRAGVVRPAGTVEGGGKRRFRCPDGGDWALAIRRAE
jgi:hypothetical protein